MLAVVVEFRIKAERIEAFASAIVDNAKASLEREPACRQFDVCRDAGEPGLFYLYEIYDDEAAFQLHLQSPHFLAMNAATAEWVESKQVRRLQRVHT